MRRFENNSRVYLYYGDSSKILYNVIESIEQPITFWLDSHWSGDDTGFGSNKYPLLLELDQISRHSIKNHTILIDDIRLLDTEWKLGDIEIVKNKILDINSKYKLSFEDGFIPNDIMVAEVI